ncbi:MAG: hypothetical protein QOF51_2727 [Chloroflexota bacterium]|nr:hypothetical protein [Chloroflexota bacterium]
MRAALVAALLGSALLALVHPVGATLGDPKLERDLIALTNADRTSNGLPSLVVNAPLTDVARERSDDMANRDYFAHEIPPDSHLVFAILQQRAIAYALAGENIGKLGSATPPSNMTSALEQGFMNSPLHRANILESQFTSIGVGYATGAASQLFTVLFMVPQGGPAATPPATLALDSDASPVVASDVSPVESVVDDVLGRTLDVPGHD